MATFRVTSVTNHYFNTFNAVVQSEKIVEDLRRMNENCPGRDLTKLRKYRGKTAHTIRTEWRLNGRTAAALGTTFHKMAEILLNSINRWDETITNMMIQDAWIGVKKTNHQQQHQSSWKTSKIAPEIRHFIRHMMLMYKSGWRKLHTELLVKGFGIRGKVDAIFKRGEVYRIIDWKRSKPYSLPSHLWRNARPPLSHYPAIKETQWSFQLNLYATLFMEREDVPKNSPIEMFIIRYFEDNKPDIIKARTFPRSDIMSSIQSMFSLIKK